jgi:cholesterol transport system auxiliary component
MRALVTSFIAAALLAGCSVLPQPAAPASEFDFGPAMPGAQAAPRIAQTVLVPEVGAPAWMDSGHLVYRLAYRDGVGPRVYSNSRWVMPPAALYTARLRERVAAASAGVVAPGDNARYDAALRLELVEFSQVFDAADASRALVQVRATLIRDQKLAAQRTFGAERKAATPDAAGGAAALAAAAEESIDAVVRWTAQTLAK